MKTLSYILVALLMASCNIKENTSSLNYTNQELELLCGKLEDVAFLDFSLTKDDQFYHFQSQIERDICSGLFAFNGQVIFDSADTLSILTIVEKYCEGYVHEGPPPPCVLIRNQQVIITEHNEVLIENEKIDIDSVEQHITILTKKFFIDNNFRPAAFEIDWDKQSDIAMRKLVFKKVIDGALIAANKLSLSKYQKGLGQLSEEELTSLKRDITIAISFDYSRFTPPPPPPQLNIDDYTELDN